MDILDLVPTTYGFYASSALVVVVFTTERYSGQPIFPSCSRDWGNGENKISKNCYVALHVVFFSFSQGWLVGWWLRVQQENFFYGYLSRRSWA